MLARILLINLFAALMLSLCVSLGGPEGIVVRVAHGLLCDESVPIERQSPDREYVARVVITNCGATTPYSTDVLVRRHWDWLGLWEQSVFSTTGRPYVNVVWNDVQTLHIEYRGSADFKRDRVWNEVRVLFREAPR